MSVAVRVEFALRGCMFEVLDEAAFGTSVRAGNFLVELGLLRCLGNTHVAQGASSFFGAYPRYATRIFHKSECPTSASNNSARQEPPARVPHKTEVCLARVA